jgi:hypothetical protein
MPEFAPVMSTVVYHADQKEEHASDGAMVEHLQHGAVNALGCKARHD